MNQPTRPRLSVVATLYQSAGTLHEFHARTTRAARSLVGHDYELILVNDGSPDESLDIARQLARDDPKLWVIDLSRNFGHQRAMRTGLAQARGELVFLVDSDLDESPEWLLEFAEVLQNTHSEVVFGYQAERRDRGLNRLCGRAFYAVVLRILDIEGPPNWVTARLMTRRFLDAFHRYRERDGFLPAIWDDCGFRQTGHPVKKVLRSPTTYSWTMKFALLVRSIVDGSSRGLRLFSVALLALVICVALAGALCVAAVWGGLEPRVLATLAFAGAAVVASVLFAGLSVLAMYLASIYDEVKARPSAIIRGIIHSARTDELLAHAGGPISAIERPAFEVSPMMVVGSGARGSACDDDAAPAPGEVESSADRRPFYRHDDAQCRV